MNLTPKPRLILALLGLFMLSGFAYADEPTTTPETFTATPLSTSQVFKNSEGDFNIEIGGGLIAATTTVELSKITECLDLPWRLPKLSDVFQFDIATASLPGAKSTIKIDIKYATSSIYMKRVYFLDKNSGVWKPLPTKDDYDNMTAHAEISLPFAQLAVFADPDILMVGKASWYKFKPGNFTASPDFPKGSVLKVINLDNGKSVDVEVNDYGPERNLFPDRVVDLEKTAFAKISPRKSGIANVRIEYLGEKNKKTKKVVAKEIKADIEEVFLASKAKSAILINQDTGEIIFDKNSTSTMPLASLTKLVAIRVFLDAKIPLKTKVKYSTKDEAWNYKYVKNKSEAAKIKLKDGDTLTVEDLLNAALVGSANNAVESLVRISGMSRDDFILKMNETAAAWGATSTKFVEPTGLSPENVSSPADYAIITKEVYKNPEIQKASVRIVYKFTTINTKKKHKIRNTNPLIEANKMRITGSKTGYLEEAGYCLMTRAKAKNGQQIIAVTFGLGTRADSFNETKELLYFGLEKTNNTL